MLEHDEGDVGYVIDIVIGKNEDRTVTITASLYGEVQNPVEPCALSAYPQALAEIIGVDSVQNAATAVEDFAKSLAAALERTFGTTAEVAELTPRVTLPVPPAQLAAMREEAADNYEPYSDYPVIYYQTFEGMDAPELDFFDHLAAANLYLAFLEWNAYPEDGWEFADGRGNVIDEAPDLANFRAELKATVAQWQETGGEATEGAPSAEACCCDKAEDRD